VQENGCSVRQVEEMVKELNSGGTVKVGRHQLASRRSRLPKEFDELKKRLSGFFRTSVQMTYSSKGKGKITIPFGSEEELERIIVLFDRMR
ncbi:MAG: chromosome partitioning protein ParB, partial [Alloprevotella sp.]|nr:chromosome partitioning protein ParB [Alloprevotella sp.]